MADSTLPFPLGVPPESYNGNGKHNMTMETKKQMKIRLIILERKMGKRGDDV